MTAREIAAAVMALQTNDELRLVIDAIRLKQGMLTAAQAARFLKGDRVRFHDRAGMAIEGTVKYVNQKSLSLTGCVYVATNTRTTEWRVAPSLCTRA
jgi:hypothetical protein